jgi:hypothetical protein
VAELTKEDTSEDAGTHHGHASPNGSRTETAPICTVALCPICAAVTALSDARPDIVEHLLTAARETLLAVQALIDVRQESVDNARSERVERISID